MAEFHAPEDEPEAGFAFHRLFDEGDKPVALWRGGFLLEPSWDRRHIRTY